MRNHVSAVLPNALASRIAISGLIAALPFTTLLRACRVTPRTFAPSVTDSPKWFKASGAGRCVRDGGIFHGHGGSSFRRLVVVNQFNIKSVSSFKTENDAPVGPNRH